MISTTVTWPKQVLGFPFVLFPLPPSPVWTAAHLSHLNVLPWFLRSCPSSETLSSAHVLVLNSVLPGVHPRPLFSHFDLFHEWVNSHGRHFTLSELEFSRICVSRENVSHVCYPCSWFHTFCVCIHTEFMRVSHGQNHHHEDAPIEIVRASTHMALLYIHHCLECLNMSTPNLSSKLMW